MATRSSSSGGFGLGLGGGLLLGYSLGRVGGGGYGGYGYGHNYGQYGRAGGAFLGWSGGDGREMDRPTYFYPSLQHPSIPAPQHPSMGRTQVSRVRRIPIGGQISPIASPTHYPTLAYFTSITQRTSHSRAYSTPSIMLPG